MIKNIVFDMGGVIIDYDMARKAARHAESALEYKIVFEQIYKSAAWAMLDRGIVSYEDAKNMMRENIPPEYQYRVDEIVDNDYKEFRQNPGIESLVKELKNNNYKIYLLSNAPSKCEWTAKTLPVFSYFDNIFFSYQYGMVKPEREIYKKFFEVFNLKPEECYFIDDNNLNIEASIFAGMKGFVYKQDIESLKNAMRKEGIKI